MAIGAPRTGSGRLLAATAAAGAAALVAAGVSSSRAAASACQPYTAIAHDAAPAPGEPFVGTQTVTIGGETYVDVPAVTTTLTTIDDAHLVPTRTTGVYRLVSHLVVTGGGTGQLGAPGNGELRHPHRRRPFQRGLVPRLTEGSLH